MNSTSVSTEREFFDAFFAEIAEDVAELRGTAYGRTPFSFDSSLVLLVQWFVTYRPGVKVVIARRKSKKSGGQVNILDKSWAPLPVAFEPADEVAVKMICAWWDRLAELGTVLEESAKGKSRAFTISLDALLRAAR